jgi:hypothetical protein
LDVPDVRVFWLALVLDLDLVPVAPGLDDVDVPVVVVVAVELSVLVSSILVLSSVSKMVFSNLLIAFRYT